MSRKPKEELKSTYIHGEQQPHNAEMERAVIAGILMDPDHCISIAVEKLQTDNAFYIPKYRLIFRTYVELFNANKQTGIDLLTVAHHLETKAELEQVGGPAELVAIQNSIATVANFDAWVDVVKEFSILRNMIRTCADSIERCHTLVDHHQHPITVNQAIDMIESEVLKVRSENQHQEIMHFPKLVDSTFSHIQDVLAGKVERGIPTGFKDLDRKIQGGVKRGEMFVLAARPSIGKTSFALNIVRNMLVKGARVAFFSLEMTAEQLARRLLCSEARISEMDLRSDNPRIQSMNMQLTRAISQIKNWPLYIDPTPALRVMEMRAKARRLKKDHNIDVIVIDYLQLMRGSGNPESRQIEVAEISSGIKALAKELDVPIIALAQLSRETDKNATKESRPKLSHLRESGAIEQDADIVAFLHRDRDKQKELSDEDRQQGQKSECIVEKNRNGEIGVVHMLFFPWFTLFASVDNHTYDKSDRPTEK